MPKIERSGMVTITRAGKESKFSEQCAELDELLGDEAERAVSALEFFYEKDDLDALVSAFRKVGKRHNRKVTTRTTTRKVSEVVTDDEGDVVLDDDGEETVKVVSKMVVQVADDGPYVGRPKAAAGTEADTESDEDGDEPTEEDLDNIEDGFDPVDDEDFED